MLYTSLYYRHGSGVSLSLSRCSGELCPTLQAYILSFSECDSPEASVVDSLLFLSQSFYSIFSTALEIYTARNNQAPCSTTVYIAQTWIHLIPYKHHDWSDPNPKPANSTTAFLHIRPEDQKNKNRNITPRLIKSNLTSTTQRVSGQITILHCPQLPKRRLVQPPE